MGEYLSDGWGAQPRDLPRSGSQNQPGRDMEQADHTGARRVFQAQNAKKAKCQEKLFASSELGRKSVAQWPFLQATSGAWTA
ncbi:MAG: hypothetical protein WAT09_02835 [Paracoccaceae bacterium]